MVKSADLLHHGKKKQTNVAADIEDGEWILPPYGCGDSIIFKETSGQVSGLFLF